MSRKFQKETTTDCKVSQGLPRITKGICTAKEQFVSFKIKQRKYALRFYHNELFGNNLKRKDGSIHKVEHQQCAETVRKIKKVTANHADVKIIFHDKNTIRSDKLGVAVIRCRLGLVFLKRK